MRTQEKDARTRVSAQHEHSYARHKQMHAVSSYIHRHMQMHAVSSYIHIFPVFTDSNACIRNRGFIAYKPGINFPVKKKKRKEERKKEKERMKIENDGSYI